METLVGDDEFEASHQETREHGPMWLLLNQMLHIIVLVYTLFGLIRFKVIFIHRMRGLVRWVSLLTVCLSWYISIKFALLGMLLFLFNLELDKRKLTVVQFNCSLDQYELYLANSTRQPLVAPGRAHSNGNQASLALAWLLHFAGGPYRLLGNQATLIYGFFSFSLYIMLALFPVEHYYFAIGFNYIRFVLNDPSCLRDCYAKKQKHVDRLNNWSRNLNSSMITLSMKRATNQRDLRSSYVYERLLVHVRRAAAAAAMGAIPLLYDANDYRNDDDDDYDDDSNSNNVAQLPTAARRDQVSSSSSSEASGQLRKQAESGHLEFGEKESEKLSAPVKSLRQTLAMNHSNEPSYCIKVASANLKKFKPYVRGERWFKISMLVYPIFIFFYFILLMIVIGAIAVFFANTRRSMEFTCLSALRASGAHAEAARLARVFANWSLWDWLTCLEAKYSVFALSCASSFFCSYYFGTILELLVWIEEISQQLNLCRVMTDLFEVRSPPLSQRMLAASSSSSSSSAISLIGKRKRQQQQQRRLSKQHDVIGDNINPFGGLNSIWAHWRLRRSPQSERFRKYELMAIRLATKRQTIRRATYINLNIFLDELTDTRFMTTMILRRTTQIAFGFALMVSITRSQFETSTIYLSVLLLSSLAILNLYLICAAFINSSVSILASLSLGRERRFLTTLSLMTSQPINLYSSATFPTFAFGFLVPTCESKISASSARSTRDRSTTYCRKSTRSLASPSWPAPITICSSFGSVTSRPMDSTRTP